MKPRAAPRSRAPARSQPAAAKARVAGHRDLLQTAREPPSNTHTESKPTSACEEEPVAFRREAEARSSLGQDAQRVSWFCVRTRSGLPRRAALRPPSFPLHFRHFVAAAASGSCNFQTLLDVFYLRSLSCSLVTQNSIVECWLIIIISALYASLWISKEIGMQVPKPSGNKRMFYIP